MNLHLEFLAKLRSAPVCLKLLAARLGSTRRAKAHLLQIVFSKDRPLQLEALLRSMREKVTGTREVVVLWRATSDDALGAYRDLAAEFSPDGFVFREELNFRSDVVEVVSKSRSRALMFLVDDLLFIRSFAVNSIENCSLHSSGRRNQL